MNLDSFEFEYPESKELFDGCQVKFNTFFHSSFPRKLQGFKTILRKTYSQKEFLKEFPKNEPS